MKFEQHFHVEIQQHEDFASSLNSKKNRAPDGIRTHDPPFSCGTFYIFCNGCSELLLKSRSVTIQMNVTDQILR